MKLFTKKNFLWFFVLVLLTVPSIAPLFHKGFFVTDDGEWMVIRLSAFFSAFRDGQMPVRFLGRLNNEYGYPVATFLYPGFMYLGIIIHLFKVNFVNTVKVIFGLSTLSSAYFMYRWLDKLFGKKESILGVTFYVYSPYYLFDVYKRGSVGEILALATVPFIFWQIERKSVFWITIGIAGLIISHNTLAILFIPLIILYMIFHIVISDTKSSQIFFYMYSILLGAGIASFFWLPVIFELPYTVFTQTNISDWRGYFASLQLIGYATVLVILSAPILYLSKRNLVKKHRLPILFLLSGIVSLFMAAKISAPVWKIIPASFIQFPFRFLSVTILCTAFLGGFIVSNTSGVYKKMFIAITIFLLSITTYQNISKIKYFDKGEGFYTTNTATTTVHDEYMPMWVKEKPTERPDRKVEIVKGEGRIENLSSSNKKIMFSANLRNNAVIQVNMIYWPGWTAQVNNKNISISYKNPKGIMQLSLPGGKRNITLRFSETPLRLISDIISLLSVVLLGFVTIRSGKAKKHERS